MKIEEIFPREGANIKRAKKIRARRKEKAKSNNPGEEESNTGWAANPYQGTFDRMRMGVS